MLIAAARPAPRMSGMRTSWTRLVALLIAAGLAAGCYESEVPLDPAPAVDVDAAIFGVWRCLPFEADPSESPATVTVARGAAPRTFTALWEEPGDSPDRYEGFASTVGRVAYLNTRERKADGSLSAWFFMRPTLLRPNALLLQVVDDKAMSGVAATAAAIREALRRRQDEPALLTDGALCARAKAGR